MRTLLILTIALAAAACTQTPPAPPKADPPPKAEAQGAVATAPTVEGAWAAATPEGVTVSAGYMTVVNPGDAEDRLISAAMPKAGVTELHVMEKQGEIMKMRTAEGGLAVPANGKLELAPGGAHLMFLQMTAPLAVGETVPVTLTFQKAGAVTVNFEVRPRTAVKKGDDYSKH